jgi:hypothetical protein
MSGLTWKCVCVYVCVSAYVCVCVCVCVLARQCLRISATVQGTETNKHFVPWRYGTRPLSRTLCRLKNIYPCVEGRTILQNASDYIPDNTAHSHRGLEIFSSTAWISLRRCILKPHKKNPSDARKSKTETKVQFLKKDIYTTGL